MERIGVVGLGTMGAGIVEVFAKAGFEVVGMDMNDAAVERGRGIIASSMKRAVDKGKLTEAERDAIVGRIDMGTDLGAARGCELVVEAAFEDLAVKKQIFTALQDAAPEAILATNTSSLSVTDIAETVTDRDKVLGVHFFNPAPVQTLVEVVRTRYTSEDTLQAVLEVLRRLRKTPVVIADRAGFIVNALLITYLNDAIRLYGEGFATREEIDEAMVAAGNPMGPLTLADLIGNDVNLAIMKRMSEDTGRALHAPAPLLTDVVSRGLLGRKSGQGFYDYGDTQHAPLVAAPVASHGADVGDRLLACYLNEVLRMVEDGYATPTQIDTAMVEGCRMPKPFDQLAEMGPRRVGEILARYAESQPDLAPSGLLVQLAEADDPATALSELRAR